MRRIALTLCVTLLAAAVGCHHIGGKCDCQSHPGDGAPYTITNPYPSAAVTPAAPK